MNNARGLTFLAQPDGTFLKKITKPSVSLLIFANTVNVNWRETELFAYKDIMYMYICVSLE